jgi:hypothetical protein
LRAEWWWPAAVAGLFCVQPLPARRIALALVGLMAVPIFALRELEPFFRTGVPLLLPAAWGLGALLDRGIRACLDLFASTACRRLSQPSLSARLVGAATAALVVVLPLGIEVGRSAGGLVSGFTTRFDWALARDPQSARRAAAFVNANTSPDDVVLASPQVTWLFDARAADLFQAAARTGDAVAFYPAAIPAARFRFDPSPERARFVVIDGYWHLWAGVSAPVARLVAHVERWPLVLQEGEYRVYRHPNA